MILPSKRLLTRRKQCFLVPDRFFGVRNGVYGSQKFGGMRKTEDSWGGKVDGRLETGFPAFWKNKRRKKWWSLSFIPNID